KNEAAFAKGQLRGVKGLASLDAIVDGKPAVADEPAEAEETSRVREREGGTALRPHVVDQWATPRADSADSFTPPSPRPIATPGVDPEAVEAAAARYLATRDPRAAGLALEAARYYIQQGHLDAASDLLLQLIAAGVADHDAQRLLVDVVRTLGKREVAKAKCELLAHALLLDGRNDLAAEVEALALAD